MTTIATKKSMLHYRCAFLATAFFAPLCLALAQEAKTESPSPKVIEIGSNRELFVDEFLIESLDGVRRQLHRPTPREIAITHDQPWEGNVCLYHTVFRDDNVYRMYYRGAHAGPRESYPEAVGHQVVCYAESPDGIRWTKPLLRLHEFDGSKENNIVWTGIGAHNFAPFKDPNPKCPPEARYKSIGHGPGGLYVFQSPDGIHWSLIQEKPVITKGAFDSQNLAFYDTVRGRYVDFHRGFNNGVRAILTATSDDFVTWTEPEWVEYTDDRSEHLYTNQTTQYARAPQLFLAFPKRFVPTRQGTRHRYSGVSDIVLMSSRDGRTFDRWGEAFIRPGLQPERWVNRNNFVAWGIVETASQRNGVPNELTFYSVEGYYTGDDCKMRRYTLRPDGFVSINAGEAKGELITKRLAFELPPKNAPRTYLDDIPAAHRITEKPIRGSGSLSFEAATLLSLEGTQNLGPQVTLAATVRGVPTGLRRLFSTYNGSTTEPNELFFDFSSGGVISKDNGYSIRFKYNGKLVGAKFDDVGDWSNSADADAVHHLAATWDDGRVTLYFDGKRVGSGGENGRGDLQFALGDLRFGEDYPPTLLTNEPFLGVVDDVLILRRALSPDEVAAIAREGAAKHVTSTEKGVLLTLEDEDTPFADHLIADGAQQITHPSDVHPGEVELLLNFSTSANGSVRCEIQDESGVAIPGYTMVDCDELFGDSLDRPLSWNGKRELKSLVGRSIRLRFELKDADLYALRFGR